MWKESKLKWLITGSIFIGIFEFLSLAGIHLPKPLALPFFLTFTLLFGYKTIWHGLQALLALNFKSINFLMLIAIAGAFYLGEYPEGTIVIILFTLAEELEDLGIAKSQSALDSLINKMPRTVLVKGEINAVDVANIAIGTTILIKPGQMIPLDGIVKDGLSFVDESAITGEPIAQDKRPGDSIFAGSLNRQGFLEVEVTKTASESTIEKIREMTFNATQNKAKTQKFIEVFSQYYTPFVILLALFWTLFTWLVLKRPFDQGFADALALLVIACPCALVISTPISIFSAIGNASSSGALIKGGRYLEAIGQIKAMAIDKTRTLTIGEPVVTDVIPFDGHSKELLLSCAAGIEKLSEHPLAQSIVNAAMKENLTPHSVENFESIIGKGAKADCLVCDDKHHCIGKLEFILEEHHVPHPFIDQIDSYQNQGKTVIAVSTHKSLEGIIALEDEIRPNSAQFIADLKSLGIHTVMLTGDHLNVAKSIAKKVGIEAIKADLLPQDKSQAVKELLHDYGIVAMFGDGVNDAPALALSNVGISMSSLGSDTAIEAASIVILNGRLKVIPFLIQLSRKTLTTIKTNIAFALAIKTIFIILALLSLSNLALAIFADVGVTLLVILNSLRLMNFKIEG
ncbi:putative cadmium-transporting ATPase [Candidatus Protochlamydia naegleriophila]|uniref:P-type Zn(2+) transporter n=1 Tax=Candidatus Protochlamydia naegleriophila TaxID=389348 RepID=A0A0U5JDU5_9BACT|nr:cation-translocating P-type ATPase [Candidatus Protochlamydia naegleriophila]CUI16053.1 putative cadmium-transporting ATPase [Candidatus Protochlamydia naegleriophila]